GRESAPGHVLSPVTQDPLKGAAGTNDLLVGIEHNNDAAGVIQDGGDKIPLRLESDVEFSNFVVAARQLRNHLLKQTRLTVHLFPFLVKLNENRNLRTENFRYKRFCQVKIGRASCRERVLSQAADVG